mmetsp:Transcript_22964/g.50595  ORF Transcript_22964/g.50595 Transcript_22964/m.50595 type:complete len:545 (-) Transcript_22964:268-1902(-)
MAPTAGDDRAVSLMVGNTEEPWRPKLTNKTLFVLGAMNMIDCINANLLTPYVDSMVSDFLNTTPDDPRVAGTVGLLVGLYSLCEVVFSPLWGMLSDRVGRKPALLTGLAGATCAAVMFGLGKDLTTVFIARGLDGFFCGNMGVTRTYLGEIVDASTEAKGFSFLSVCFSLGLFIGPILGGELVYPAKFAPQIFADTIFETHPFLLPNLTYAIFAAISWTIGACFLEETLPKSERLPWCPRRAEGNSARTASSSTFSRMASRASSGADPMGMPRVFTVPEGEDEDEEQEGTQDVEQPRAAQPTVPARTGSVSAALQQAARPAVGYLALVQVIAAYCAVAGYTSGALQLFVVIIALPQSVHGFSLGPAQIGALQNVSAVTLMIWQLFIYGPLVTRFGYLRVFLFGWILGALAYGLFPVYDIWYSQDYGLERYAPLCVMQMLVAVAGGCCFPTVFTLVNRAATGLARGSVNGWANSSGALCRALLPPAVSLVLTWGNSINPYWGRYLAIYINILVSTAVVGFALPGIRKVGLAGVKPGDEPQGAGGH